MATISYRDISAKQNVFFLVMGLLAHGIFGGAGMLKCALCYNHFPRIVETIVELRMKCKLGARCSLSPQVSAKDDANKLLVVVDFQ